MKHIQKLWRPLMSLGAMVGLLFSLLPVSVAQAATFEILGVDIQNLDALGRDAEDYRTFTVQFSSPAKDINILIWDEDADTQFHFEQIAGSTSNLTVSPGNWKGPLKANTNYRFAVSANAAQTVEGDQSDLMNVLFKTDNFGPAANPFFQIVSVTPTKVDALGNPAEDKRTFNIEFSSYAQDVNLLIWDQTEDRQFHFEEISGSHTNLVISPGNWENSLLPNRLYSYTITANSSTGLGGTSYTASFRTSNFLSGETEFEILSVRVDKLDALGNPAEDVRSFGLSFSLPATNIILEVREKRSNELIYRHEALGPIGSLYISPGAWTKKLQPKTTYVYSVLAQPSDINASPISDTHLGEFTTGQFSVEPEEGFRIESVDVLPLDELGNFAEDKFTFNVIFSEPATGIEFEIWDETRNKRFHIEQISGTHSSLIISPGKWERRMDPGTTYTFSIMANSADLQSSDRYEGTITTGSFFDIQDEFQIINVEVTPRNSAGTIAEDVRTFGIGFTKPARSVSLIVRDQLTGEVIYVHEERGEIYDLIIYPGQWTKRLQPNRTYRYEITAQAFSSDVENPTDYYEATFTTSNFQVNTTQPSPESETIEEARLRQRIAQLEYQVSELENQVVQLERSLYQQTNTQLVDNVAGRIILQVEENGEAWYVDPATKKKYYLKDGQTAYVSLGAFGVGVTNDDLERIPVGVEDRFQLTDTDQDGLDDELEKGLGTDPENPDSDGDGFLDGEEVRNGYNPLAPGRMPLNETFAQGLQGKILLQVESRGEAWYVNPTDGKRYYLGNGDQAYQIMRFLSLGINNTDLRQIPVGELR